MASPIPDLEIVFNFRSILILLTWDDHNRGSLIRFRVGAGFSPPSRTGSQVTTRNKRNAPSLAPDFPRDPNQRIVIPIHNALLQRNNRVVRNVNLFGTDFRAAFRDVAVSKPKLFFQQRHAIAIVERMHFQSRDANEKSRPAKLRLLIVVAQNVANVLAQETLDALPKFLNAIRIFLIKLPIRALLGLERRNLFVDLVIPGNVGHQIFDHWKCFDRTHRDRLMRRQRIHARFAGQPRPAIHFRRTRTALPRFAIPAHREILGEMPLNVVERIENDHARRDRHGVVHRLAAVLVSAKHIQDRFGHLVALLFDSLSHINSRARRSARRLAHLPPSSASTCFSSSGKSDFRSWRRFMRPLESWLMMLFLVPHSALVSGKSMRLCAPRLSSRTSAHFATASEIFSIECRSRARCQPGLNIREPSTLTNL